MYQHNQRHTLKRFDIDITYAMDTQTYLSTGERMAGFRNRSWGRDHRIGDTIMDTHLCEQIFTRPDGTVALHRVYP